MKNKLVFMGMLAGALILSGCGKSSSNGGSGGDSCDPNASADNVTQPLADGVYDYTGKSYEDRSEILGKLETYGMKNHLCGIPLYDDSSFEQFSKRLTLPTTTYITNYGFGVGEATINATGDMYNGAIDESKAEWKSYFHGYTSVDSGTFNYWDSQGADVADRNSMITTGYFEVAMNEAKNDYKWFGSLSKTDRPIMLTKNASGEFVETAYTVGTTSQYWRIKLKTGTDGIKYATSANSTHASVYNGKAVELADYLVPYKTMLDNRFSRASSLTDDASGFVGASDYMYSSKHDWKNVGIQLNETAGSLDFSFITPKTQYYAMTNLSSGLFSPIPEQFLTDIGGAKNFGVRNADTDYTKTMNNVISCGAYVPEYWEKDKELVYKKNADYFEASEYHFAGVTEVIFAGTNSDVAAYEAFKANQLDEVTIPVKEIKNHSTDPNTYKTKGSTVIKLNLNSCTEGEWAEYFGTDGSIYKHKADNYWDVKPIMSNDDFLNGLYFAIDRKTLAADAGRNPALGYLSDAYMCDPEGGEFYRQSAAGKAAIKEYTDVNEYGYSASLAGSLFQKAVSTLECQGYLSKGQTITITCYFRYQDTIDNLGKTIKKNVEDAFNGACPNYTLNMDLQVGGSEYTDTYTRMDHGEYDIAEGAISGNVLNPIEFMSTICTDDLAQGFCLNWGSNTNKVNRQIPLEYDGKTWTYDSLWKAANSIAIVSEGVNTDVGTNARFVKEDDTYYFRSDYPEITDDDGNLLLTFECVDPGIFMSKTAEFNSGFYMQNYSFTAENGFIDLAWSQDVMDSYDKSMGGDNVYIYIQYTLRYTFESKNVTKNLYGTAKIADIGADTEGASASSGRDVSVL